MFRDYQPPSTPMKVRCYIQFLGGCWDVPPFDGSHPWRLNATAQLDRLHRSAACTASDRLSGGVVLPGLRCSSLVRSCGWKSNFLIEKPWRNMEKHQGVQQFPLVILDFLDQPIEKETLPCWWTRKNPLRRYVPVTVAESVHGRFIWEGFHVCFLLALTTKNPQGGATGRPTHGKPENYSGKKYWDLFLHLQTKN